MHKCNFCGPSLTVHFVERRGLYHFKCMFTVEAKENTNRHFSRSGMHIIKYSVIVYFRTVINNDFYSRVRQDVR